jgi:hypothetical protein
MLNIVLVASLSVIAMIKDQQALQAEFDKVKQIENKYGTISLTLNAFPITQARLLQNNITFKLVDKPLCSSEQQHPFIYSWSVICDPDMQMNTE